MGVDRSVWGDSRPDWWSPEWCPEPSWGTRRRPGRLTQGVAWSAMAERFGTPPTPAQRLINDVAGELDEDGVLAYRDVVVLVHRQFGKTTLTLPRVVSKALAWRNLMFSYTAQDRNHGRRKLEKDFVRRLRESSLREGRDFRVRLAAGSEGIRFPRSGSEIGIFATKDDSGHGDTLDEAMVDEAWRHETTSIDEGFRVPMITRGKVARDSQGRLAPGPQLWVVSAAGDWRSEYLASKTVMGREASLRDSGSGVAHLEWQLPEGADPENRALWWMHMPGLGHTMTEADVAADLESMDLDDWLRAYGNRRKEDADTSSTPFDVDAWVALGVGRPSGGLGRRCWAVEVMPDRSWSSVVCAVEWGELVLVVFQQSGPGTVWVPEAVAALVSQFGGVGCVVDRLGPAGTLVEGLERAGVRVVERGGREVSQWQVEFVDKVNQGGAVRHLGQEELTGSVISARVRKRGESWGLDRAAGLDSTPVLAAALAVGGLGSVEEEREMVSVYSGRGFYEW